MHDLVRLRLSGGPFRPLLIFGAVWRPSFMAMRAAWLAPVVATDKSDSIVIKKGSRRSETVISGKLEFGDSAPGGLQDRGYS